MAGMARTASDSEKEDPAAAPPGFGEQVDHALDGRLVERGADSLHLCEVFMGIAAGRRGNLLVHEEVLRSAALVALREETRNSPGALPGRSASCTNRSRILPRIPAEVSPK